MRTAGSSAWRSVKVEGETRTPVHGEDAGVIIFANIFFDEVAFSFVVEMGAKSIYRMGECE